MEPASENDDQYDEALDRRQPGRAFNRRATIQTPAEALQPQAVPPSPKRAKTKRKRRGGILYVLSGILTFALVVAVCLIIAVGYGKAAFTSPGPLAADKIVFIPRGSGAGDAVDQLEREGIIDNSMIFNAGLFASGKRQQVKAGEYLFKAHATPAEVLDAMVEPRTGQTSVTLREGQTIAQLVKPLERSVHLQRSVTLPEGLTSEQMVQRLRGDEFLSGSVHIPAEGTLLPETYVFSRGDPRETIVKSMQAAQQLAVNEIWAKRNTATPIKSVSELVTMASLVEKETGKVDERPHVAGVFVNRLMKRMKLQSDPTIIYGLVGGKGTLGRPLLASEVREATPYNTYVIEGLPPGPICNPGRAALEAAANPMPTRDLYFVADGTGGHAFADTLDQHQRNVARWRQIEKEAKEKLLLAPPADPAAPKPQQKSEDDSHQSPDVMLASVDAEIDQRDAARRAAVPKPVVAASAPAPAAAPSELAFNGYAIKIGPSLDSLMPGMDGSGPASEVSEWDGKDVGPVAGGPVKSYPMSAARVADLKAREARWGLEPNQDARIEPAALQQAEPAKRPCRAGTEARNAAPRAFDASEGTALDPLRNMTYDLNSPKAVPAPAVLIASLSDTRGLLGRNVKSDAVRVEAPCAATPLDNPIPASIGKPSSETGNTASHALDASEGKAFDPLLNKSFDLNSAQTVPAKPLAFASAEPANPTSDRSISVKNVAEVDGGEKKPSIYDASEGTSLDPLRNKSFDLNSPQTVPTKPIVFASLGPVGILAQLPASDKRTAIKPHVSDASEGTRLDPLRNKTFDLNSPQSVPSKPIVVGSLEPSLPRHGTHQDAVAPPQATSTDDQAPVEADVPLPVRRPAKLDLPKNPDAAEEQDSATQDTEAEAVPTPPIRPANLSPRKKPALAGFQIPDKVLARLEAPPVVMDAQPKPTVAVKPAPPVVSKPTPAVVAKPEPVRVVAPPVAVEPQKPAPPVVSKSAPVQVARPEPPAIVVKPEAKAVIEARPEVKADAEMPKSIPSAKSEATPGLPKTAGTPITDDAALHAIRAPVPPRILAMQQGANARADARPRHPKHYSDPNRNFDLNTAKVIPDF